MKYKFILLCNHQELVDYIYFTSVFLVTIQPDYIFSFNCITCFIGLAAEMLSEWKSLVL